MLSFSCYEGHDTTGDEAGNLDDADLGSRGVSITSAAARYLPALSRAALRKVPGT